MSYQGPPPPGTSPNSSFAGSMQNNPRGMPGSPQIGGQIKFSGHPQAGMFPPPGINGPGPGNTGPPMNGQPQPYMNSGFPQQGPQYGGSMQPNFGLQSRHPQSQSRPPPPRSSHLSGPSHTGPPPSGPPPSGPPPSGPPLSGPPSSAPPPSGPPPSGPPLSGPPLSGPPPSGPPPSGPTSANQFSRTFQRPPHVSSAQNAHLPGNNVNSQPPQIGPYGQPNQGLISQQPVGPQSGPLGPPRGVSPLSQPLSSPQGLPRPLGGPGVPTVSAPPPSGMLPPSSTMQGPPPPSSHSGQGGGDFHAGSSEKKASRAPYLELPQGVGMIKSPSTGSLGRLPMPHLDYPQTPSPITEMSDPLANISGPPSERSSATPSPVPTQRLDALEGGTPFSAGQLPPGMVSPVSQGPPRAGAPPGPQQRYYGPPPTGSPMTQQAQRFGPPPTGPPGPPTGPPGPPTGPPGPPTGPPSGPMNQGPGLLGKRQYPQQPSYYGPPTSSQQPNQGMMAPNQNQAANSIPRQAGMQQNQAVNNINAGVGNLRLQQGDIKALNLLTERHILPPTRVVPPKAKLSQDYQRLQVNPDVFRCTLTAIPQTQSLLQKSRLPLGLVIHPFRDLSHLPVIQSSVIVRCRSCRTYINPFVTFPDQRRWKCNLCHRTNDLPEEFNFDPVTKTYGEPQRRPEIKSSTIEFIAPSEYMLRPPQPAVYLFLMDVSFGAVESGYLSVVCQTLLDTLDKMPGDARTLIGFLTFDSALHFYNLQEGATRPQMLICSDLEDVFLPCANDLLVNVHECKELITELLTELPNLFLGNKTNQTALGPALQAALKLVGPTGGRVTVFQSSLPSVGVGALKAREDPSQRAASKNIANLGPATDFYKKMALDFSGQQVAVDTFIISSQYTDIATLAGVSKFSGGCIFYYPGFHTIQNPLQVERLEMDFKRYLSRKIGFEAVMRIRCTKGMSMHTFHGNFFVRSTDLLSLPNVSPDAGFAMQVSIEDPLQESTVSCFQAALLYTSSKGERRIRVHTMCLPVTNQLSEVMAGADQRAIVGLLSRMAVDRSVTSSVEDARDALVNVCVDVLSAFKSSLPEGQTVGALMVPTSLKLLPLYCLSMLKNVAFRLGSSTRLDERVFTMEMYKCEPLLYIMLRVYPDLYALHSIMLADELLYKDKETPQPTLVGLSSEYINKDGAYLMDRGDTMYLFVGRNVSTEFLTDVLDVPDFQSISEGLIHLPELENEMSDRVRSFIDWLLDNRPYHAPLRVIRDDGKDRILFIQHLVHDRAESSMSYYEFLQHLQKEVK